MRTDIDTIYIGGEWITPLSTSRIEIRSSATGQFGERGALGLPALANCVQ